MNVLEQYSEIVIPTSGVVAEGDVTVTVTSKEVEPLVELSTRDPKIQIQESQVIVSPDLAWFPGSEITVSIGNLAYSYLVPTDELFYAPEHYLYSNTLLGEADLFAELIKVGLVDPEEQSLLQSLGEKSDAFMLRLSKCLVAEFTHSTFIGIDVCTRIRGLRRMQQILYMLGLDVLVEYFLFSPGPKSPWFSEAYIEGTLSDSEVISKVQDLVQEAGVFIRVMQRAELNVDILESIGRHISPSSPLHETVRISVIMMMLLRYTHDNPSFKY